MTTATQFPIGASSTWGTKWDVINWHTVEAHVQRLQLRIAKAIKLRRYNRVKSLQWLLTHSFYAKLLAVKRVTQNSGKNTPGVDRTVWKTPAQKMQAVQALKKRVLCSTAQTHLYPKEEWKTKAAWNPPTMIDRSQQALHLFALESIADILADENS